MIERLWNAIVARLAALAAGLRAKCSRSPPGADYDVDWSADSTGGGNGGGLDQDAVDARIAALRPNPFTTADETKLDGIETAATADQTATEIRDALAGLTGSAKLSGTAIEDGSLGTAQLADDSVTQAKIGARAVGTTELANEAVTTAQIASQTVIGSRMGTNSVGSRVIADGAVTTNKLGNLSVTLGKLAAAVTARLVPTGGTAGQVLKRVGASGFAWGTDNTGGGNGGGTQTLTTTNYESTATPSVSSAVITVGGANACR